MNMPAIFSSIILILLLLLFAFFMVNRENISDNVKIAVIAGVTTILTILGTVMVTQMTNANNLERDRNADVFKIKQENYSRFVEALSDHLSCQALLNSQAISKDKALDAQIRFLREQHRVPLYASQAVVEWVNSIAIGNRPEGGAEMNRFYSLVRSDLCTSTYQEFKNLPAIFFQLPGGEKK
jgi:hypothetical protein